VFVSVVFVYVMDWCMWGNLLELILPSSGSGKSSITALDICT
jgi:hypothetical protein